MNKHESPTRPVLMVDDDSDLQKSFAFVLRHAGIEDLVQCLDSREAEPLLTKQDYETVLLDLNMPHVSGRDLLPLIVRNHPEVPVIVVTGVDDVKTAVQCMRNGAFDYLVKPVEEETLVAAVRRAMEVREMRRENTLLKKHLLTVELTHPEAFAGILTSNRAMHALFQYMEAVATSSHPILITGETGVGKALVAKAAHKASARKGEFVAVNIAGVDDNVFSDTLFGHTRGAFTGAVEVRKGLIERAAGGTLFLDEIGDLSAPSQVKLLRLTQEREYFPLGADTPRYTDARIIVATNRDLVALQKEGKFRDDLFYRLRSHQVHIPPLRERKDDLPLLTDHFLKKAATELGTKKPTPPRELFTLLASHDFPGNVRELESMIYNAVSTHKSGILSMDAFRAVMKDLERTPKMAAREDEAFGFDPVQPLPTVDQAQDLLIEEALRRTDGNRTMAADLLGITRQTLMRRLKLRRKDEAEKA